MTFFMKTHLQKDQKQNRNEKDTLFSNHYNSNLLFFL